MATPEHRGSTGGITLGGIIVIVGIVVAIFWSVWLGVIIALIRVVAHSEASLEAGGIEPRREVQSSVG